MTETRDFRYALEAFLASKTFGTVVRDDLAQQHLVLPVVALARDGSFTVFSSRADGSPSADRLVLDIPYGRERVVGAAMRRMLVLQPQ